MAETNTALKVADVFVDAGTLNALPLADVFRATGPARVVAENVTCGPVEVFDKPGEEWWLVRIEGSADVLKPTEAEALSAADPQIHRHVARLEGRRERAAIETKRQQDLAARIAACPGHEFVEYEIARCLYRVACKHCGKTETVATDG